LFGHFPYFIILLTIICFYTLDTAQLWLNIVSLSVIFIQCAIIIFLACDINEMRSSYEHV